MRPNGERLAHGDVQPLARAHADGVTFPDMLALAQALARAALSAFDGGAATKLAEHRGTGFGRGAGSRSGGPGSVDWIVREIRGRAGNEAGWAALAAAEKAMLLYLAERDRNRREIAADPHLRMKAPSPRYAEARRREWAARAEIAAAQARADAMVEAQFGIEREEAAMVEATSEKEAA